MYAARERRKQKILEKRRKGMKTFDIDWMRTARATHSPFGIDSIETKEGKKSTQAMKASPFTRTHTHTRSAGSACGQHSIIDIILSTVCRTHTRPKRYYAAASKANKCGRVPLHTYTHNDSHTKCVLGQIKFDVWFKNFAFASNGKIIFAEIFFSFLSPPPSSFNGRCQFSSSKSCQAHIIKV